MHREDHPRQAHLAGAVLLSFAFAVHAAGPAPSAPAVVPVVPAPPSVAASAWLVQDFDSGQILVEHNIDARVEPASLTKMMTAYVVESELAAGRIRPADPVRISERAWRMEGSKMFVEVDKEVAVEDLMRGVIIQSGNDASVALAEHVGGTEEVFVAMMNEHARRLGMTGTHFTNSTGWPDPEHYTTARDLAILGSALIRDFPEGYRLHAEKEFVYNGIRQRNRNELLWSDSTVDGIKTGHTESAGYCLVASALRDGMRLVSVVMGAPGTDARANATAALLNYVYRFYERSVVAGAGQPLAEGRVWKGAADSVSAGLARELRLTLPRGGADRVERAVLLDSRLVAPIAKGERIGTFTVRLDGKVLAQEPLVALAAAPEAGLFGRLADEVRLWFE
jgi:D-alanyl-D-alanine carboxypeptidase (penicillin-binding protein 5/6)